MQQLCQFKVGWNEKIPDNLKKNWVKQNKLSKLEIIKQSRCYKPDLHISCSSTNLELSIVLC